MTLYIKIMKCFRGKYLDYILINVKTFMEI